MVPLKVLTSTTKEATRVLPYKFENLSGQGAFYSPSLGGRDPSNLCVIYMCNGALNMDTNSGTSKARSNI